jgi:hypothetical protein
MPEVDLYNPIRLAAATIGCVLRRNNVGMLRDARGQYVRFGLGTGTGDLIGFIPLGGVAVFVSVEVKPVGWKPHREPRKTVMAQDAWRKAVNDAGGIGLRVTSIEEFLDEMRERMP